MVSVSDISNASWKPSPGATTFGLPPPAKSPTGGPRKQRLKRSREIMQERRHEMRSKTVLLRRACDRLRDRGPSGDLAPDEGGEFLGRHPLRLDAFGLAPLRYRRRIERGEDSGIEPRDDVLRHACRPRDAEPGRL